MDVSMCTRLEPQGKDMHAGKRVFSATLPLFLTTMAIGAIGRKRRNKRLTQNTPITSQVSLTTWTSVNETALRTLYRNNNVVL